MKRGTIIALIILAVVVVLIGVWFFIKQGTCRSGVNPLEQLGCNSLGV